MTWNEGAKRVNGYESDEIIGQHFSVFYPRKARDAGVPDRRLREALENGPVEDQSWRIRKDGSRFWGSVRMIALNWPSQL